MNELTIVQALGIDSSESETEITVQFLNINQTSDSTDAPSSNIVSTTSGSGKSISEAVFSASKTVSDKLFTGQNKIIVFGFEYAQNQLVKGIEYLCESSSSRPDVLVALSKESAKDIIKSKENGSKIPAESICNLITLGERNGNAAAITVCDLLNLYNDETSDIYLPVLSENEGRTECASIACFSNEKFAVFLEGEKAFAFMMIKNKVESGTFSSGNTLLNVISSDSKNSVEIKNREINFNINIKIKMSVNEIEKDSLSPLTESDYKNIEAACESKLKALCESAVYDCFSNKSDPFMCARYLYSDEIALYDLLKDNWRENLKNIRVNAKVNAQIQRIK